MTTLTILNYPDPRLHKVAKPIAEVNNAIRNLVVDMAETMYAAPGIGLAATQVDQHIQLIVIDISKEQNDLLVFINPKIVAKSGQKEYEEGCLSVPGVYETVTRAEKITVEALDKEGKPFTLDAEGLLAVCIQHEMDHLLGKVFVEYLSPLKRGRIKTKMLKHSREIARNAY
jgi:peptide deformylase